MVSRVLDKPVLAGVRLLFAGRAGEGAYVSFEGNISVYVV